jgi:ribonuclease D
MSETAGTGAGAQSIASLPAELAEDARASGKLALDTEFVGEGRYRTLLCLIQLAVPRPGGEGKRIVMLDPLAEGFDGASLAELLADPQVEIVVHAGRQDIALARRVLTTEVTNVFDTQVAAGFAGMGAQSSYESLLGDVLGVRVAKSASFTRWERRPLSPEQLSYAREDVEHLLELASELERRLDDLGRLEWAREECSALARSSDERDLGTIFARLPRVRGLSPSSRPIARALVQWREETAARQDRPVQSVLGDAALMEIAKRKPRSASELEPPPPRRRARAAHPARARAAARGGAEGGAPARAEARGCPADRARRGAAAHASARGRARLRAARRARRPAGDRRRVAQWRRGGGCAHAQGLAARARRRGAARAARRVDLAERRRRRAAYHARGSGRYLIVL